MKDTPRHGVLDAATLIAAAATLGTIAAPATAQLTIPKLKTVAKVPATETITRHITFQGSETEARAQAASLRASDPIQSNLLSTAIDAARVRPGFNPAAVSIALGFTMKPVARRFADRLSCRGDRTARRASAPLPYTGERR
ncbi:hypothetical protein ACVWZA_003374 [Sphingomonas sp. UYAg733]